MDKQAYLEGVAAVCEQMGKKVSIFNIGERMYREAPDVPPGRILDLPLSRLIALRRSVFKDLLAEAKSQENIIVNTHATFRWRHGLFYAFDYDMMKAFNADQYVTLVDNIDRVHARLLRDGHTDHTLKDLMVWREEEALATELLAQIVRGHGCFYVQARGIEEPTADSLARLMFSGHSKKAYLSFPMSHLTASGQIELIKQFRREMKKYFVCFDPGDLEEKPLGPLALNAAREGHKFITLNVDGKGLQIETAEILAILSDIDGQIYARDFKLIDQSDMIISLVPQIRLASGREVPALSSGVERELQHAYEAAKDVFVIWLAQAMPSPFITETATRVFPSVQEAVDYWLKTGYVPSAPAGGLFA
jgi:hypothetical protein